MNIIMVHLRNIGGVAGGLERVLCEFSNAMVQRGHKVSIVIYDDSGKRPYYKLENKVQLINIYNRRCEPKHMKLWDKVGREWARVRGHIADWYEVYRDPYILPSLQEIYEEFMPDVILNQYYTSSGFIYASHPPCPVINMIHSVPERVFKNISAREREGMEHSALVQVLLPDFLNYIQENLPRTKCICIPNFVNPVDKPADLSSERKRHTIIHVGRLDKTHKRQHILISAFAKVADKFPNWDVQFWGDGHESYKKELRNLINSNHLEYRVKLCGATSDVIDKYIQADIFAFPSASEGFGLALAEAMSAGIPAVGYKSCQSCAHIIKDGRTGLLAEDGVDSFAKKLEILMSNREMRICMGRNAQKEMAQYAPQKIWDKWEEILNTIVNT